MWQTRLEDEGRRQVCYKYRARAEDPAYRGGDVTRATNSWEAPEIGRPGALTFGLNSTKGRLCRLGRLRAARRARLPDLPARALGFCRDRAVLWRSAWRRQPRLRLRGRRARLRDPQRAAPADGDERRARRPGDPGDGHGEPGRGSRLSRAGGPVLRRRGRPLHRRDALRRRQRREPRKGQATATA